ncbi:uncharacterized protein BDW70DRAFT_157633 [Aspergillus foveolatus]|uniref:uncharacterized protein n=1 Tax=Aspergillus foveolatus TaxID=210207 RepID=UPI003CCCFAAB
MSGEINRLSSEVQEERTRRTELQSTVSNLEQGRDRLNDELQQLQVEHAALENAHAVARHAEIRMRWQIVAHRARCRSLKAEVAELKSSRLPKAKAKQSLANIRRGNSSGRGREAASDHSQTSLEKSGLIPGMIIAVGIPGVPLPVCTGFAKPLAHPAPYTQ